MFAGKIEKLGIALSDAFTARARYYFQAASTLDGATKANHNLMGAMLGEIGKVILDVTKRESDSE